MQDKSPNTLVQASGVSRIASLEAKCRAERRRALGKNWWTYDLPYHVDLLRQLKEEREASHG